MENGRKVSFYLNSFRQNKERNKNEEARELDSWKFFSGVNNGQWKPSALETLQQEGRPTSQFNFIQGKVLSVLGHYLQNPLDAKFEAEVGSPDWGPEVMNYLMKADADKGHWEDEEKQFLLSLLIHSGTLELYKDTSRSPLGHVGLRYVSPDSISFDYRWRSANIDECPRIYVYRWMTADKILATFKKKTQEISEAVDRLEKLIDDPTVQSEDIEKLCDRSPDVYDAIGQQHLVIQALELKTRSISRVFDKENNEFLQQMEDSVARALVNLPQNEGKYTLIPDSVNKLEVFTICPSLGRELVLEDGPHPIQIGGYPYINASALNLNGERQGIVEVMKDTQEVINKREATITHIQMTRANGVELIESDAFDDDTQRKNYIENANKPGYKAIVASGSNREGKIMVKNAGETPHDLIESVHRSISHMDRMWAPPPMQAGAGKSGESGDLFEAKRDQALVALEYMNRTVWRCKRELLDKYFSIAKQIYSKIPRKFSLDGTSELKINWPQADGSLLNDLAKIPRLSTRIVQSQQAASLKRERINTYTQFGSFVTTPIVKAMVELLMIDTVPDLPQSHRQVLKDGQMEYVSLLRERMAAERLQIETGIKQQLAQQQAQPPPGAEAPTGGPSGPGETPASGGGISAEGKSIPPQAGLPVDVRQQNQLK